MNTADLADAKAATSPGKAPPKQDQKGQHPKHGGAHEKGRLEAHKQPLKNEASLDVLNAFTLEFQNALKKSAEGIIEAGKVLIRVKKPTQTPAMGRMGHSYTALR